MNIKRKRGESGASGMVRTVGQALNQTWQLHKLGMFQLRHGPAHHHVPMDAPAAGTCQGSIRAEFVPKPQGLEANQKYLVIQSSNMWGLCVWIDHGSTIDHPFDLGAAKEPR